MSEKLDFFAKNRPVKLENKNEKTAFEIHNKDFIFSHCEIFTGNL